MVTLGGSAMSKSRGNVVDPNAIISQFGADTARLFILFAAPPEKQLEWSDAGVEGSWRFLNRVWRLCEKLKDTGHQLQDNDAEITDSMISLRRKTHWAINKVTRDFCGEHIQINTAIAAVMELVNELYLYPKLGDPVSKEAVRAVVQLLSPVAPHLMEELWENLGENGLCSESKWPSANPKWLEADTVEIVVQINGKLRARFEAIKGLSNSDIEQQVLSLPKVQEALKGKVRLKIIFVPDKLVNIVTK